jgi:hypothetical protein
MTDEETEIISFLAKCLSAPRDRFGRLMSYAGSGVDSEKLRKLVIKINAPDGGLDTVDQVRMVLQGLAGEEITSSVYPKRKTSP